MKYFCCTMWCSNSVDSGVSPVSVVWGREMTGCPSAVESDEPLFLDKILQWKYVVGDLKWKNFSLPRTSHFLPFSPVCGSGCFFFFFSYSPLHWALVIRAGNFLIPVFHGSLFPPSSFLPVAYLFGVFVLRTK